MKHVKPNPTPQQITALIDRAIREGRHSTAFETVCDGCREWVSGIYWVSPTTKHRLCAACANKAGVGPDQDRPTAA